LPKAIDTTSERMYKACVLAGHEEFRKEPVHSTPGSCPGTV
jgi:hypothetical protein